MKEKISALIDGELGRTEFEQVLTAVRAEGDARQIWRTYHLIGDTMRDTRLLSPGFSSRIAARLAEEPTVLAPVARPGPVRLRSIGQAVAVGLLAVVLVGGVWRQWTAERSVPEPPTVAKAPPPPGAVQPEPVRVAPPAAAHDYLLAHERYSPRRSLQGMAVYVRTVSDDAGARRP